MVLQKAEAFYGKPNLKSKTVLIYGDAYKLNPDGSAIDNNNGEGGLVIEVFSCFLTKQWPCLNREKPTFVVRYNLGSGLIDHIQKITVAAMQIADMKVCAHRS